MVMAMLMLLAVPPLNFPFMFFALRTMYWIRGSQSVHRVPFHIQRRAKLIKFLYFAWLAEIIAFFWLSENWPFFMSWWD
jgi:hypothetical protein